jgi:hypothetical protein
MGFPSREARFARGKLIIAYNQFGKAMGEGIVCPLVLPLVLPCVRIDIPPGNRLEPDRPGRHAAGGMIPILPHHGL